MVNIPIGAKSEHIATALANSAPECKLVYYDDKQKVCYLHCASVESKDKLLLKGTLPLLSSKPAIKSTTAVQTKEAAKPDPMPVVVSLLYPSSPIAFVLTISCNSRLTAQRPLSRTQMILCQWLAAMA